MLAQGGGNGRGLAPGRKDGRLMHHLALDHASVAQAAADIRALVTQTATNVITIGQKRQEVKAVLLHGQWGAWLKQEFDWSESLAIKMMQAAEAFKSVNLTDLRLDVSSLYLLAAPSTPPAARAEAVALAQDGAALSVPKVKALISKHRGVTTLTDYQGFVRDTCKK
jgi:Protein of unknown function (DUF3102)